MRRLLGVVLTMAVASATDVRAQTIHMSGAGAVPVLIRQPSRSAPTRGNEEFAAPAIPTVLSREEQAVLDSSFADENGIQACAGEPFYVSLPSPRWRDRWALAGLTGAAAGIVPMGWTSGIQSPYGAYGVSSAYRSSPYPAYYSDSYSPYYRSTYWGGYPRYAYYGYSPYYYSYGYYPYSYGYYPSYYYASYYYGYSRWSLYGSPRYRAGYVYPSSLFYWRIVWPRYTPWYSIWWRPWLPDASRRSRVMDEPTGSWSVPEGACYTRDPRGNVVVIH